MSLQPRQRLRAPKRNPAILKVLEKENNDENKRVNVIHKLNDEYDTLIPRWKGVALTANAELDAEGTDKLPWANIKFSSGSSSGKKVATIGSDEYARWEQIGVATGESMPLSELAKYRYHIDLGGGGGTTWSGTIEKLALPGLLFHHVTPMKDYIHDHLTPWKHYIPVSADLKDLRSKFNWAESHPVEAKRIADEGTKFMRELGTPQGFEKIFEQDFVEPVRRVIEAYQPVANVHQQHGNNNDGSSISSWKDVLDSLGDNNRFVPVLECNGIGTSDDCQLIVGDDQIGFNWKNTGNSSVSLKESS